MEGRENTPTCHDDTLAVVLAGTEGGQQRKTPQRVISTRWGSFAPMSRMDGGERELREEKCDDESHYQHDHVILSC